MKPRALTLLWSATLLLAAVFSQAADQTAQTHRHDPRQFHASEEVIAVFEQATTSQSGF